MITIATITSLSFNITSKFDNTGLRSARNELREIREDMRRTSGVLQIGVMVEDDSAKRQLAEIRAAAEKKIQANIDIDIEDYTSSLAKIETLAMDRTANIDADLDADPAMRSMTALSRAIDDGTRNMGQFTDASHKMGFWTKLIIAGVILAMVGLQGVIAQVGAALLGGLALASTAAAAVLLKDNEQVRAAFDRLKGEGVDRLRDAAAPMASALSDALNQVTNRINVAYPLLRRMWENTAPLVRPLTESLLDMATVALPGINSALASGVVAMAPFREGAIALGSRIGEGFRIMGTQAEAFGQITRITLTEVGIMFQNFSAAAAGFAQHGQSLWQGFLTLINGLVNGILIGLGGALDQVSGPLGNFMGVIGIQGGQALGALLQAVLIVSGAFSQALTPALQILFPILAQTFIAIANALAPAIIALTPTITFLAQQFANFLIWLQPYLPTIVPIVAALWALSVVFGWVVGIVGIAITVFGFFSTAIGWASSAWGVLSAVFSMSPLGWVILAIVAVIAIIVALAINANGLGNTWNAVWGGISGAVSAVWQAIQNFWSWISGIFAQFMTAVAQPAKDAWADIKQSLLDAWNTIRPPLMDLWQRIQGLAQPLMYIAGILGGIFMAVVFVVVNVLMNILGPAIRLIGDILGAVIGFISGLIQFVSGVLSVFVGIIGMFVGLLVGIFTGNWDMLNRFWTMFYQGIVNMALGIWNMIQAVWDAIIGIFRGAWNILWGIVKGVVEGIVGFFHWLWDILVGHSIIPDTVNAIIGWFVNLWNWGVAVVSGFINVLIGIFNFVKDVIVGIWNWIWGVISAIWGGFWGWISQQWNNFLTGCAFIWGIVRDVVVGVWNWIWGALSGAWNWFWGVISGAWNNFVAIVMFYWNFVKDIVTGVWNWIWGALKGAWDWFWGIISGAWNGFVGWISGIWDSIKERIQTAWGRTWAIVKDLWDAFWRSITNAWDRMVDFVTGLGERIGRGARKMWDGIKDAFKGVINWIIDAWNGLEFKIPGFSFGPIKFDGFTLSLPDIPRLATGGAIEGMGGTPGKDSVLAALMPGEHVLTADEVRAGGGQGSIYALREMLRSGVLPGFADGGAVGQQQTTVTTGTGVGGVATTVPVAVQVSVPAAPTVSTSLPSTGGLSSLGTSPASAPSATSAVSTSVGGGGSSSTGGTGDSGATGGAGGMDMFNAVGPQFAAMLEMMRTLWEQFKAWFMESWNAFWQSIIDRMTAFSGIFTGAWNAHWMNVLLNWNAVSGALAGSFSAFWNGLLGIWGAFNASALASWANFLLTVQTMTGAFTQWMGAAFAAMIQALSASMNAYVAWMDATFVGLFANLQARTNEYVAWMNAAFVGMFQALQQKMSEYAAWMNATFGAMFAAIKAAFDQFRAQFDLAFMAWTQATQNTTMLHRDAMVGLFGDLWGRVFSISQDMWGRIQGGFNDFRGGVESTVQAMVDRVGEIWGGIPGRFEGPVGRIKEIWNGVSGILGLQKFATGGAVQGFATGGDVTGAGTGTSDSIPAMLSNGEHVLTARDVDAMGGQSAVYEWRRSLHQRQQGSRRGFVSEDNRFAEGGAIEFAKQIAKEKGDGRAYVYGGTGPDGFDCSGYMSAIFNALTGRPLWARSFSTESNFGALGFQRGLSSRFAMGVHNGGGGPNSHMAGTLDGVNVESGGAHNSTRYGGPAAGADHGQFEHKYFLPEVGGQFISGGGGGGGAGGPSREQIDAHKRASDEIKKTINETLASAARWKHKADGAAPEPAASDYLSNMWGVYEPAGDVHGAGVKGAGDSALKKLDEALSALSARFGAMGGTIPEGERLAIIKKAMEITRTPPPDSEQDWLKGMNTLITRESNWNSGAVNTYDSNARAGNASRGLAQVIPTTFEANKAPGYDNIDAPVDNVAASINYIKRRYGSILAVQQANANMPPQGYKLGTRSARPGWHLVGENGPEAINFRGGEPVKSFDDIVSAIKGATDGERRSGAQDININANVKVDGTSLTPAQRKELSDELGAELAGRLEMLLRQR